MFKLSYLYLMEVAKVVSNQVSLNLIIGNPGKGGALSSSN